MRICDLKHTTLSVSTVLVSLLSGFILQKIYDHFIGTNITMDVHIKRVSIEQGSTVQISVKFHNFTELQWNPAITKTLL